MDSDSDNNIDKNENNIDSYENHIYNDNNNIDNYENIIDNNENDIDYENDIVMRMLLKIVMWMRFKIDANSSQPGWSSCPEEDQKIHLEAREIRTNSWSESSSSLSKKEKKKRKIRTNS